jgi:hypothetical protein
MMYSGGDSNIGIIFGFKSFTPKIFFHMCEQPVITWGKIWREGRMCQHIPPSALHQILHITMVKRCCIVLEKYDAKLKQFW